MKYGDKKSKHTKVNTSRTNQVRIIGGQFKRANVTFVEGYGLRPTPDRMRETLFNWLMNDIHGAKVLDAFAGSGVLGFEALSRGADSVVFIENNKSQYQQLLKTTKQLKLSTDRVSLHYGNCEQTIPQLPVESFDLVFLDPPYALNLWQTIITLLMDNKMLTSETYIYVEADKPLNQIFEVNTCLKIEILKEKRMGQVNSWLIQIK